MMEPAELPPMQPLGKQRRWALTGADKRPKNIITSIYLDPEQMEKLNLRLQAKLDRDPQERGALERVYDRGRRACCSSPMARWGACATRR